MRQLHDVEVLSPKSPGTLSTVEKNEAFRYPMFLKRKREGQINGRGFADGRKRRRPTTRSDVSSPTIATDSVFLNLIISAKVN